MFDDGRLQTIAGTRLLENSHLVTWDLSKARFNPIGKHQFEEVWRRDIDPIFGRLICWIMFSSGAEFLAKGVCLVRGIEFRREQKVPAYPLEPIQDWASNLLNGSGKAGQIETTNFGTFGDLTGQKGALSRLCEKVCADQEHRELLIAAYTLLQKTIRNRDAHAYVPNARDFHHSLVAEIYCECFNLLVGWLPDGAKVLNKWREEAPSFISQY